MMNKEICNVVSQVEIADSIYELTLKGELVQHMSEPGQFVHLKVSNSIDPLLRRPISIAKIDKNHNEFTMIYRKEGRGTTLLAEKTAGEEVDVLGPLGHGFPVEETTPGETALLVGGGIGAVFYESEFALLGETYIATADGSYGSKGFVTDVIGDKNLSFDTLYSCGPTPMLKALNSNFADKKVFLSLEERMGCGIGACFACVCHTGDDKDVMVRYFGQGRLYYEYA